MSAQIRAAAMEVGDQMPEDLDDVELWPASEPYYTGFNRLNPGRRAIGVGMGSVIPLGLEYSQLVVYAHENGLDVEEFVDCAYALDEVYLRHAAKKVK